MREVNEKVVVVTQEETDVANEELWRGSLDHWSCTSEVQAGRLQVGLQQAGQDARNPGSLSGTLGKTGFLL